MNKYFLLTLVELNSLPRAWMTDLVQSAQRVIALPRFAVFMCGERALPGWWDGWSEERGVEVKPVWNGIEEFWQRVVEGYEAEAKTIK